MKPRTRILCDTPKETPSLPSHSISTDLSVGHYSSQASGAFFGLRNFWLVHLTSIPASSETRWVVDSALTLQTSMAAAAPLVCAASVTT